MTMWEFLATTNGIVAIVLMVALIGVILYIVAKKGVKFKNKSGEEFQLGDDTPFEKTNARFKQLCQDTHSIAATVPLLTEQMKTMQEQIGNVQSRLKEVEDSCLNNSIALLRLTFHDERLSPEERITAGKKYLALGGNGPTEVQINEYIKGYQKNLAKIQETRDNITKGQ
jgi:hypothetical protein